MSHQHFSAPPSELAREIKQQRTLLADAPLDVPRKQTREEYRRLKELEELRKAGSAPAAVDEQGHDINPHIPQYMVDVPWYVSYDHSRPTLKHQRIHPEKKKKFDDLSTWIDRSGTKNDNEIEAEKPKRAPRYKPGACENCGSTKHKRKECLERPRKVSVKYGNGPIAEDECTLPELNLSWDGKRDRWNGVDLDVHQYRVVSDFERLDDLKRRHQQQVEFKSDILSDDDKYVEEMDMPGQKVDSKQRISVRNLRIREDTAKYLLNLDPNSAYYDPKSRSMRDDPFTGKDGRKVEDAKTFFGDNFVRSSGDSCRFNQSERFAWESQNKGVVIHQQADPTRLQMLHKEYNEKKQDYVSKVKETIFETYGGKEHLISKPEERLVGTESSMYLLYDRDGDLKPEFKKKMAEQVLKKTKYPEDVYINGHTSVWGSFYCKEENRWGYRCCKALFKNAYCTAVSEKGLD